MRVLSSPLVRPNRTGSDWTATPTAAAGPALIHVGSPVISMMSKRRSSAPIITCSSLRASGLDHGVRHAAILVISRGALGAGKMPAWLLASLRSPPMAATRASRSSSPLRRPDGTELNIFTTLARHPRLMKRWSAFGGVLLYGGTLPAARAGAADPARRVPVPALPTSGASTSRSAEPWASSDDEIDRVAAGPDAGRGVRRRGRPAAGHRRAARRRPDHRRDVGGARGAWTSSSSSRSAWWSVSTTWSRSR